MFKNVFLSYYNVQLFMVVDGDVEYRILQFLFLLPGDVSNTVDERVVPSLETFLRHVQSGI